MTAMFLAHLLAIVRSNLLNGQGAIVLLTLRSLSPYGTLVFVKNEAIFL